MTASSPRVWWFPDTASLLSLAASTDVEAQVRAAIGTDVVVVVDAVVEELQDRLSSPDTSPIAERALVWVSEPLPPNWKVTPASRYVSIADVEAAQDDVADGSRLVHPRQHWAESVIIAFARQAHERQEDRGTNEVSIRVLSEDFNARRVAGQVPIVTARSICRILWERVRAVHLSAADAAAMYKAVSDLGRSRDITEEEFGMSSPKGLGHLGKP